MKKTIYLVTALASVLFFYSCSKEKSIDSTDPDGPGGGGNTNGSLLSKIVNKSGIDSAVFTFSYDASQRLVSFKNTYTDAGAVIAIETLLERNSEGILKKIIIKSNVFSQYGLEGVTSVVNYDAAAKLYKSKVMTIPIPNLVAKDSTAYEYDNAGRIIRERVFSMRGSLPYIESGKIEYAYSNNNMVTSSMYTFDSQTNTYENDYNLTQEFDDKTSPLIMGNEAILINESAFFSSNNVVKQFVEYPDEPADNETMRITYTYNSAGKPVTGTFASQSGSDSKITTYYYQ